MSIWLGEGERVHCKEYDREITRGENLLEHTFSFELGQNLSNIFPSYSKVKDYRWSISKHMVQLRGT